MEYHKAASKEDGLDVKCKSCARQYNAARYLKNRDSVKQQAKEWRENNKERKMELDRKYAKRNKEKLLAYTKEWRKTSGYYNKQHQAIMSDPLLKFKATVGSLIRGSFKRGVEGVNKQGRTEEILQCSLEFFLQYIQSKFTEGMTLENHGEWHLDHIVPLATAKSAEDIVRLNHYTNFQPLWAKDNLSKGAKII